MHNTHDTAYAKHGNLSYTIDPPAIYRDKTQADIVKYVGLYGVESFVDKLNSMTDSVLPDIRAGVLHNHDIFLELVREWFDEHYPPISRSRHQGWLPVRLATRKHL